MKKSHLGRGLDALLPSDTPDHKTPTEIPIENIKPSESQPRRSFDEKSINELSKSIKEKGLIQPILVRKKGDHYEIVAGERRWRACQKAGLKNIAVIVKDLNEDEILEIALIENLQREDLDPIEEAEAYEKLINKFDLTHEEISKRIGKDRSTITNQLRLLKLTEKAKSALINEKISAGHARALLSLEYSNHIDQLLDEIIKKKLSVRQAEQVVKIFSEKKDTRKSKSGSKNYTSDRFLQNISEELKKSLRTKVTIKGKDDKGKIEIQYYSKEELERLIGILTANS